MLTGPEPNFRWRASPQQSSSWPKLRRGTRGHDGSPARRRAALASRLGPRQLPGRLPGRLFGPSARARGADGHHRRTAPRVRRRRSAFGELLGLRPALPARRPFRPRCHRPAGQLSALLGMEVDTAELESTAETYQEQSLLPSPRIRTSPLRPDARRPLRLPGGSGSAQLALRRRPRPGTRRFPPRTPARRRELVSTLRPCGPSLSASQDPPGRRLQAEMLIRPP